MKKSPAKILDKQASQPQLQSIDPSYLPSILGDRQMLMVEMVKIYSIFPEKHQ